MDGRLEVSTDTAVTTDQAPAAAARSAALHESGWSSTFRFVQPRNLAFWVYIALVASGVLIIVRFVNSGTPVYGTPITLSVAGFIVYGLIFWGFTQHIDRYARQSRKLVVLAVLWGGFGAITMASSANTPILSLWVKAFGQS